MAMRSTWCILAAAVAVITLAVAVREPPVVKVVKVTQAQPEGSDLTDPQHCHLVIEPAFATSEPPERCAGGGLTNEGLKRLQARFGVYGQPYKPREPA